jgi:Mrp family chromosome partitioning ATPase
MRALLQKLSPHFSWILIDSPPVLPLTDTLSLRQQTDASLLVIRADSTPQKAAEEAIGLIGKHHILGVVLNGVQDLNRIYMKYGYYAETPAELKAADSRGIPSGD